jgi:hypothetical protein
VRRIPGVRAVQNLLHPRGTPAPNKERSLEVRSQKSEVRRSKISTPQG